MRIEETTSRPDFPLVTVLVAAYNEERRIGECLDSLLAQTYHPLEILVLDDGSTDRTVLLAEGKAGIKVMSGSHQGKARTMNEGAARAGGAILVFADADIVYDPDYVRALVQPIRTGQVEGSSHLIEKVANPENVWSRCWQWIAKLPPDQRLSVGPEDLTAGSRVYRALRRDRYLAVGGFDPTGYSDDQTLATKLQKRAVWVPEACCRHYNVESLREVWRLGVWTGKTIALQWGLRSLWQYNLLRGIGGGLLLAWQSRLPALFIYHIVITVGRSWGILSWSLRAHQKA